MTGSCVGRWSYPPVTEIGMRTMEPKCEVKTEKVVPMSTIKVMHLLLFLISGND